MSGRMTVTRWPPRAGELLGPIGQDVGRFGHEVDAAEGDRPALARCAAASCAELVAVAAQVRQGDHLVLLVVVAEDQQPRPHRVADRLDPLGEDVVGKFPVRREIDRGTCRVEQAGHGGDSGRRQSAGS